MADEPREVTTFCPWCGKPIIWTVTPLPAGDARQLDVTGHSCQCPLSDEEWDRLAASAAEAVLALEEEERD